MQCQIHKKEMEWLETAPGRKTLRCKECHSREYLNAKQQAAMHPLLKFGDTFHRELPIERVKARRDR